ncbi:NUDIX domain-containing protein [Actinokineospora fastidiosa]|uniref:Nudix hydrolase domain-containing protein n=1 Tax=Actinokineospora fastidiosa TaxID=1816 RepID=A0A918GUC4_9PSEU|nr:NUDIX domain-containing protein [Actinokineospora fastidiosa]GGS59447.1 hypothetical protein GCM10010171_62990 [Actinokineospora fastidiosa]
MYGLVGNDERLLAVHDQDVTSHRLPGGLVLAGEAAESALRRILREQVNAEVAHLDFYAVVERRRSRGGRENAVYELALLFDVTLIDPMPSRLVAAKRTG